MFSVGRFIQEEVVENLSPDFEGYGVSGTAESCSS